MNYNCDKLFTVIKRECERQTSLAEISCFERIARLANVSVSRLPLYLSQLQDNGLIKYSVSDKFIYLTSMGRTRKIVEFNPVLAR